jgi:NAD(P)-dependent dehydrogenase (short-subunit alcohol dehydrogenase family)
VVIVTGAGAGLGRAHALACAAEGARVIVNDVDRGRASDVVEEIRVEGGTAMANADDVADFDGAHRLIQQAVDTFGGLDALVNNAGILRDRTVVAMSEDEWDAVIRVHMRGTFAPLRWAADYWRRESKAGRQRSARVVNTTSSSGLFGNDGQANYAAAKAGIAGLTLVAASELARYGICVNAINPTALTQMTANLDAMKETGSTFAPEKVARVVAWLVSEGSAGVTGRVVGVRGARLAVLEGWVNGPTLELDDHATAADVGKVLLEMVAVAAGNAAMSGWRS